MRAPSLPLAEILTAAALVGGWLLIVAAFAVYLGAFAWLAGIGVLLLALGGFRLAVRVALEGLYVLTGAARG